MPMHASNKLGGVSLCPGMYASLMLWIHNMFWGVGVTHEGLVCGVGHVVLVVGVAVLD